ncbi:MAG: 30S ribosomal protein S15 [Planctomycetes bacterium]|nr:30S ribosomal protein S15 [Planctomycetota bacterium]
MVLQPEEKKAVIASNRTHDADTGSAEVQAALLTKRIEGLSGHLKVNVKDHASRRGLLAMVNRRAKLLKYLERTAYPRYKAIVDKLGLRR